MRLQGDPLLPALRGARAGRSAPAGTGEGAGSGAGRAGGAGGRRGPGPGPLGAGRPRDPRARCGDPGAAGSQDGPEHSPPAATPQPGYCELFASITLRAGAHLSLTCYVHIRLLQLSLVACAVFINFPHSAFIAMTNRISAAIPTINLLIPVALRVIGFSLPFQDKDIIRKKKKKVASNKQHIDAAAGKKEQGIVVPQKQL